MDSVLQKAYHYSKDEKITKFITPYKKVTHLLEWFGTIKKIFLFKEREEV